MTEALTASARVDHLAHEVEKLRVRLAAARRLPAVLDDMDVNVQKTTETDRLPRDMVALSEQPFWVSYQVEGPGTATITTYLTAPAGEASKRALVQVRVEDAAGEPIDLTGQGISISPQVGPYIYLPTERRETKVLLRIPVPRGAAKLSLGFRTWGAGKEIISVDRNLTAEIHGEKLRVSQPTSRIVGHPGFLVASSSVDWECLSQIASARPSYTFEITKQPVPTRLRLPKNVSIVGGQDDMRIHEISSRWSAAVICLRTADDIDTLDGSKITEHLAPGLPIVSLRSPHIRDYPYAWTVQHPASLVAVLDEVMS